MIKILTNNKALFRVSTLVTSISLVLFTLPTSADEFSGPELTHSQTDFGMTGLMQMPSARMRPDGEFSLGVDNNDDYIQYHLSLQLFPWLETAVRYTQVHDVLYSNNKSFSGDTDYTDKSLDAKLRLLQESYYLPQVSIGLQDLGGTGLFDGEYIAANKQFGPLDITLGLGWGYIGNRGNFLSDNKASSSNCGRSSDSQWGTFSISRLFTGCKAIYGGLEYQTPYEPLVLKLEYDGNDYQSDYPVTQDSSSMPQSTPWNVGIVYKFTDWGHLQLSYERGNTFTAGLTMETNLSHLSQKWLDDPAPKYNPAPEKDNLTPDEWKKLSQDLVKVAGYQDATIYQDGDVITVTGTQTKYRNTEIAEKRAATLIANTGIKAKTYRLIHATEHIPMTETRIDTSSFKQEETFSYPNASFSDARQTGNPVAISGKKITTAGKDWFYGLSPHIQQSFGGSEDFYLYALGIVGSAGYHLGDHWLLSGSLYGDITDNYDKFQYEVPPDGTSVKRVRTLNREYFSKRLRVDTLQLNYFDKLSTNIYSQAYAGYLESMYAGAGTEFLYRPRNSNLALGFNINYVKQRDPDTYLGLFKTERHFDEDTQRYYNVQTGVTTGHATMYWQPKFWSAIDNTLVQISAGRYLAEDIGVTIDVSKQFDSGVIAGVFVAKTDMSAEEFGEGSFNKGFYVSIPLDVMLVSPTRSRTNLSWLPLQRDGGQMLGRKYDLYGLTDSRAPWYTKPPMY